MVNLNKCAKKEYKLRENKFLTTKEQLLQFDMS